MAEKPDCLAQCYTYLARRDHSCFELSEKLRRKGFEENAITETVAELVGRGYLNDRTFARSFAMAKVERLRLGPGRLRQELQRRGFSASLIDEVVEERFPDGENEERAALEAARSRFSGGRKRAGADEGADAKEDAMKKKIYDYLLRRGFTEGVCRVVALDRAGEI